MFEDALRVLAGKGLNIFASARVRNLSREILDDFNTAGIELSGHETLCILGHGGRALWENLPKPVLEEEHPFDNFSLQQVQWLNEQVIRDPALKILFPGGYFIPLQKIGRFLNVSRPSVLGLDMNQEFGVWFAFRAAFLTGKEVPEIQPLSFASACDTCRDKPCQTACPPAAVKDVAANFQMKVCATYRLSQNSQCIDKCLARLACPYKSEHRYPIEQSRYHNLRVAHLNRLARI